WASGSVTGLRARGDVTLDMQWSANQLQSAKLYTGKAGTIHLRSPLSQQKFQVIQINGAVVPTQGKGERRRFTAEPGETYLITKIAEEEIKTKGTERLYRARQRVA